MHWIDISDQTYRHVVIAQGTPTLYNGQPTTVALDDNRTIFCFWTEGHGGPAIFFAKSEDTGLTWKNIPVPKDWSIMVNCPSIYKLKDKEKKERLTLFAAQPNISETISEDLGQTWSSVKSLNKPCVMAFSSIVQLNNGDYLGLYHRGKDDKDFAPLTIWSSISQNGGVTWSDSKLVGQKEGRSPCEPCVIRSLDGSQLACITRENQRVGSSLIMFSEDEGNTWSNMKETIWELTGDRHVAKYAPDGRLVIAFRDRMPQNPYYGHFVIWIGKYDDILQNKPGQYRIKVLHSYDGADCGYSGLEILPDGTVIATTYIKYKDNADKQSIISARFNMNELDSM